MITEESEKRMFVDGLKSIQENANTDEDYLAVPLNYFLKLNVRNYGCDIYIKIKKTSGMQFIKLLPVEESFSSYDLKRYFNSGLEQVYILKTQFPALLKKFEEIEVLDESNEVLFSETLKISRKQLEVLNIDEIVIKMVEESVEKMMKNVGEKNALAVFVRKLKEDSFSYNYARVYLINLLMFKVLDAYEWKSVSIRKTITFACFFHDISIAKDELIKICSKEHLEKAELSKDERELVLTHAARSAEILEKFPRIPLGAASLVREHHGVKSGQGFVECYPSHLSPLTVMFIVVEDFVGRFLDSDHLLSKKTVENIFIEMEKNYNKNTFFQSLSVLKQRILVE